MVYKKGYVLIHGATGLVGQELVRYLMANNYKIAVLARNINRANKIFGDSVIVHSMATNNIPICSNADYPCVAIVNLAGANIASNRWTREYKKQILDSRIQSVELLKHCVDQMEVKPKVWIQASAVGYYGSDVMNETDESGQKGDGFLADVVSNWEEALETYQANEMRKVFVRLGIVMTKKGGFLKQVLDVSNLGVVALPYVKNQKLAWIHIQDLVNVIQESIINTNYSGKVNVVSPKPASMDEIKRLLLKNSWALFKIRAPKFIFNMVLGAEKTKEMILVNQNIVSNALINNNFTHKFENLNSVFESDL